ncbi:MAG: hypothetical protein IPP48_05125 [Chitinophagaceae bacterium]|nr:hypothetical protein [Chitinophagaceae bacterium]
MRKVKYICLLSSIIIIHQACSPKYVPNVINVPLLSKKGEVHATVNGGISGFDPQVAVAVSNHIGVIANGSFANEIQNNGKDFHKHSFAEIGAGYFDTIQKNCCTNFIVDTGMVN